MLQILDMEEGNCCSSSLHFLLWEKIGRKGEMTGLTPVEKRGRERRKLVVREIWSTEGKKESEGNGPTNIFSLHYNRVPN